MNFFREEDAIKDANLSQDSFVLALVLNEFW